MIKFLDGPAGGQELSLRRAPLLLRVVIGPRGRLDALDQLGDEPRDNEQITVYRRRDDLPVTTYHVRMQPRSASGIYWSASYSALPEQPADEQLRTTAAWRKWAEAFIAGGGGIAVWKRRALLLCERGLVDDAIAALTVDLLDHDPELAAAGEPAIRHALFNVRAPPALRKFIVDFAPTHSIKQEANHGEGS